MSFLLLILITSFLLAACGGQGNTIIATPVPEQTPIVETAPPIEVTRLVERFIEVQGEPIVQQIFISARGKGDELNILYWQLPRHLNVYLDNATPLDLSALTLEPLARYDETGQLIPWLAEEIPTFENGGFAEDLRSITWKLREDIEWSDGSPLTAHDVAFTVEYCQNRATNCVQEPLFTHIFSTEIIDLQTIRFYFDEPTPYPYQAFVGPASPVLQKTQFEECMGELAESCREQNEEPVGTGPYVLDELERGETAVFVPNEQYRDPYGPFFSQVVFNATVDATSAARAVLETGEADYAWNIMVQPQILQEMVFGGHGQVETAFGSCVERVVVNLTNPDETLGDLRSVWAPDGSNAHPILSETAVRQALSLAIDRPALVNQIYGHAAQVSCNILPAPIPYASPNNNQCQTQNLAAANALLNEAGIQDVNGDGVRELNGLPLQLTLRAATNPQQQLIQEQIQSSWAEIGVATTVEAIEAGRLFSSKPEQLDSYTRFYADLQMYTDCFGGANPDAFLQQWTCDAIALPDNSWQGPNIARYCNPLYDEMAAQFGRTAAPAERAQLAQQMNDLLVQEGAVIPLVQRGHISTHANNLIGVRPNAWDSAFWNIADWSRTER